MKSKRMNGEGTYGKKKINGIDYFFFRDPEGHYTYSRTQSQLKEKLKEKESKPVVDKKFTFIEYMNEWLLTKKGTIQQSTYDGYEDLIRCQVAEFKGYDLANKQLQNLSTKVFQSYLNALAEHYSKATIQKIWVLIKQCVKYGEVNGDIPVNTTAFVKVPVNVAVEKKEVPFLTMDQAEQLYSTVINFKYNNGIYKYHNNNNAKAIVFIMYSGLRVGELCALKWKNVDMNGGTIRVAESRARIKDRDDKSEKAYKYIDKSPKSKDSARLIPIPTRGMEILNYFYNKYKHGNNDYVFVNSAKNPIDKRNINRTLAGIQVDARLPKFSVHSLRHTYGSILIENGVDIKKVSELLGHSDISITYNIYIGVTEDSKREAVLSVFG